MLYEKLPVFVQNEWGFSSGNDTAAVWARWTLEE
jgi:hypothetical protein